MWRNSAEQHDGTVKQCGIVWWNSVEQCGGKLEKYGGTGKQHGGTV